jgi:hypothetical protein
MRLLGTELMGSNVLAVLSIRRRLDLNALVHYAARESSTMVRSKMHVLPATASEPQLFIERISALRAAAQ